MASSTALSSVRSALLLEGFDTSDKACALGAYDAAIVGLQRACRVTCSETLTPVAPDGGFLGTPVVDRLVHRLLAAVDTARAPLGAVVGCFGVAVVGRRPLLRLRLATDHRAVFAHHQVATAAATAGVVAAEEAPGSDVTGTLALFEDLAAAEAHAEAHAAAVAARADSEHGPYFAAAVLVTLRLGATATAAAHAGSEHGSKHGSEHGSEGFTVVARKTL